ncbi:hypothetical protein [Cellulomonas sp. C5510]|uniref:hypothetical protein n=1 Tax=Cellulomonas sp. C5510 TaxID=2871170 RepID=UPI001C9619E3|nr:hypothetical protein [Cellulomonas sp. C5510]QZN86887.1 hypothetical protein K5O09_07190 [Cellulomonas sp. C5510]
MKSADQWIVEAEDWIALAVPFVSLVGIFVTAMSLNRPQKRLEAMRTAMEVRKTAPAATTTDLDRFIRFTAAQIGQVWWRSSWVFLGASTLAGGVATALIGVWLLQGETGVYQGVWWLAGGYGVVGVGLLVFATWRQKTAGYY